MNRMGIRNPWMGRAVAFLTGFGFVVAGVAAPAHAASDPDEEHKQMRKVSRYEPSPTSESSVDLDGLLVAIDAGHAGGNAEADRIINSRISDGRGGYATCDSVGLTSFDGLNEADVTFELGQELARQVEEAGGQVVFTRATAGEVGPCLDVRGRFAEDTGADVLISLHAGDELSDTTSGFVVEVANPPLSSSQVQSRRTLGFALASALTDAGLEPREESFRGVADTEDNVVLNFARRPAASIDVANIRHSADAELLADPEFSIQVAAAIVDGLERWEAARNVQELGIY